MNGFKRRRRGKNAIAGSGSDFFEGVPHMLYWAIIFLVVAIIAGLFGFLGVAGLATEIAKILFVLFLIVFVISLIGGFRGRR